MESAFDPQALLRTHLRHSISVTKVGHRIFEPGIAAQDEIVTTNRLILVLKGRLNYRMEDQAFRFAAGTQFYVPAWIRRVSRVPSRESCEAVWCEFDIEGAEVTAPAAFLRRLPEVAAKLERKSYRRLHAHWVRQSEWSALQMEGELKAMLARFWSEASPPRQSAAGDQRPIHPKVKDALRWLADHYRERDALTALYREAAVSPNYLRKHFQEAMACSPGEYIQRLRLRQARYLLLETGLPQKQIAAEVGYEDPLYFSRIYRRLWGKAPGVGRK
ncbi:helix-turn-helix domain-containing protein [soil metagenome]